MFAEIESTTGHGLLVESLCRVSIVLGVEMAGRSDVRARMVSAGEDLLGRQGYGVTMLEVVERADAPRGSIYYHFPKGS
jgi:hypothetical protein